MRNRALITALAAGMLMVFAAAPAAVAEEEKAAPNVDQVLDELAKIGPEKLVVHMQDLKKKIDSLKAEADAARKKAAELETQSQQAKQRVETIEKFLASVKTEMAKPAEKPAEEAKAEAPKPEEKPAEEKKAEEPAKEAKKEEAPAEEKKAEEPAKEG